MRLIIAGSRGLNPGNEIIQACIEKYFINTWPTLILSGACHGPDRCGESWAKANNVLVQKFPADWKGYGKAAGPIRNRYMADNADALLAFWDGASNGTAHMIACMQAQDKHAVVVIDKVKKVTIHNQPNGAFKIEHDYQGITGL